MVNYSVFCVLLLFCVYKATGDCSLSLSKDFGRPSPVFIKDGDFLAPNASTGAILFQRSETLTVACPGDKRKIVLGNQTTSYNVLEAHCIFNNTFRVDRWIGSFDSIRCNTQPWFSSEEVNGGCLGGNKLYKVGYKIKQNFHVLYEACFDSTSVRTLYVKHEVKPSSVYIQKSSGSRPSFNEGGLFGQVSMADVYKVKKQAERINQLMGPNSAEQYLSKTRFLTRGHLAARADFSLGAEQKASFHYVNTAPQWQWTNAGPWAALEDGLRRRVKALGRPVTVYTGTFGVFPLGNGQGLHLATDKNNNNVVPVPMYFYKLVYDPSSETATAFLSPNLPARNNSLETTCETCTLPWFEGRTECCDYEDIAALTKVPDLKVKGVFL